MISNDQLYMILSEIMKELEDKHTLPDIGQAAVVSEWHDEYGSILHGADFDFAVRHFGKASLEASGANQNSIFTVNYFGGFLLTYKAEFPDGYTCHNLKNALVGALRSDVINFEYEDLFSCNMLKKSEFSELLEEVHRFVEPLDHPWYGAKTFYDELSRMNIQNAAVACLYGKDDLYETQHYIAVVDNSIIVIRKYFSSDMSISWNR